MSKQVIILITGAPATGKTTLGNTLAEKYKLAFISKDALKERIFDNLGWKDKEWSLKVSAASHRIMDYFIEQELKAGHSIILESNFKQHTDSERFRKIQEKYQCQLIQILCWAEGEILFKRFMDRIGTEKRHPGQVEIPYEKIHQDFVSSGGKDTPLDINGPTLDLNTTDLTAINYQPVHQAIETALSDV